MSKRKPKQFKLQLVPNRLNPSLTTRTTSKTKEWQLPGLQLFRGSGLPTPNGRGKSSGFLGPGTIMLTTAVLVLSFTESRLQRDLIWLKTNELEKWVGIQAGTDTGFSSQAAAGERPCRGLISTNLPQPLMASTTLLLLFSIFSALAIVLFLFTSKRRDHLKAVQLKEEVDKRALAERSMNQSYGYLKLILDSTMEGIFGVDPDGKISFSNAAACRITGYSSQEIKTLTFADMVREPARVDSGREGNLAATAKADETRAKEGEFLGKGGCWFPVTYNQSPILQDKGNPGSVIVTFQDISTRKLQEMKITRYTRELERSNRKLNDFAYVASHDLKAPLRGISQLANWIRDDIEGNLNRETEGYFDLLQNRVSRLERLLEDLLFYSRVDHNHGDFKQVDVAKLVNDIFDLLDPPKGFKLICDKGLPKMETLSVPFELLVRNLINNAIKHHDQNQGEIRFSGHINDQGYEFTVADDGPGIPEEHRERIFRIFQTLKPRDEVEGSGMGLSIVKKILENYQCHITVQNNSPRGTRMSFTWPKETKMRSFIGG